MLIEFKIHLDGSGTPTVSQADAAADPSLPAQKQLGATFVKPSSAVQKAVQKPGGDQPLTDPGTGQPNRVASSGSGTVFVVGPIVIFGSGAGQIGPGGDQPLTDPGTGKPK